MTAKFKSNGQSGFGLLEAITGLLVFVLLAFVGTKAFKHVVANHKEAAQVKILVDAVTETAEKLSMLSVAALSDPSAGYLNWSPTQTVGKGEYVYRYRIIPRPSISGAQDSTLVGLEVETGTLNQNVFTVVRRFATLIAPHISSKDGLGQVSTQKERDAEASFYASLRQRIASLTQDVVPLNQVKLNSYTCYDKGQCCGFMKEFFKDPLVNPADGLKEKCLYRCALTGGVSMTDWQNSCGTDFCGLAPWKTKEDCCNAISSGNCLQGSVCASVCYDCVHEDGSGCAAPVCDGGWWNDIFDCANGTYCDGTPLPDGDVPGWGNVKNLCKLPKCGTIHQECSQRLDVCCESYWKILAQGGTPDPRTLVCATISKRAECCDRNTQVGNFDFVCTTSGTVEHVIYHDTAFCPADVFKSSQNKYCAIYQGCSGAYGGSDKSGGPPGCPAWPGSYPKLDDPWQNPIPPPPAPPTAQPPYQPPAQPPSPPQLTPPVIAPPTGDKRVPPVRGGSGKGSAGGQE